MHGSTHTFWAARVENCSQYLAYLDFIGGEVERRQKLENDLLSDAAEFQVSGQCGVCQKANHFKVDYAYAFTRPDGSMVPNWRERLECECGLNNRTRAALQFLRDQAGALPTHDIYVTEQVTPLYKALKGRYGRVVGSEYIADGTPRGSCNPAGIRCEDITRLSFANAAFDYILSFDVLEHVPGYDNAIAECYRCLKPSGKFLLTVPFCLESPDTIVRARLNAEGQIEHLLPPEYHGDPINGNGVLCFYHFGWALLDKLRQAGFREAAAYFYWSQRLGYLGGSQMLIMAAKG